MLLLLAHANLPDGQRIVRVLCQDGIDDCKHQKRIISPYRNVIVNRLRPAEEVDQPVEGRQLAPNDLFSFNVTGEIHAFNIVDGNNAARSTTSTAAQPSMGTYYRADNIFFIIIIICNFPMIYGMRGKKTDELPIPVKSEMCC